MLNKINIGLLDFGLRTNEMNSLVKIKDLCDYAIKADDLGFSRLWLGEHFSSSPRVAWTDPTPLISMLAMMTRNIRIGTGGILLKVHNPLQIATHFKLFNNLFQNRIDLGFANGGSFNDKIIELSDSINKNFDDNYRQVLDLLRNENKYFEEGVVLPPFGGTLPQIWSMSSSSSGYKRALDLKTNFIRSIFHTGADRVPQKELLIEFKEKFFLKYGIEPNVSLAISGCCQKSFQKAKSIFDSLTLNAELHFVGDANYFYDKIMMLCEEFGVNEIIFKDIAKKTSDRDESIELIAEMFCLQNDFVFQN